MHACNNLARSEASIHIVFICENANNPPTRAETNCSSPYAPQLHIPEPPQPELRPPPGERATPAQLGAAQQHSRASPCECRVYPGPETSCCLGGPRGAVPDYGSALPHSHPCALQLCVHSSMWSMASLLLKVKGVGSVCVVLMAQLRLALQILTHLQARPSVPAELLANSTGPGHGVLRIACSGGVHTRVLESGAGHLEAGVPMCP